jgi:ankyrin repeat protein
MAVARLPAAPNLDQLKKQAKDLQRAVQRGNAEALAEVAEHAPDTDPAHAARFTLQLAQLVIARRYGFSSWAHCKRHIEVVTAFSRFPDRASESRDPADEFLRLACLNYEDDGPQRWREARAVLAAHPDLAAGNIYVAAATADRGAVEQLLAAYRDRARAREEGGPHRWPPLMYLAYARHDPNIEGDAVVAVTRALLAAGADPNAGYLWHGLPTPFTLLTGVFGGGELGIVRQPPHPHALALARELLDAGADPNDGQALYNRMFERADDHLELLFEYGLGRGAGGVWHRRLGAALDAPERMVRDQLSWAVTHGMGERVRLLVEHGVDVGAPFDNGRTPAEAALLAGNVEIANVLVVHGAAEPQLDAADALVAAILRGDTQAAERIVRGDGTARDEARARRPSLVVQAAANGRRDAVALALDAGFDVNALGRGDTPIEQPWETALHVAVGNGDVEIVRDLLARGADPSIHDARFDGTASDWARHFGNDDLVSLLDGANP